MNKLGLRFSLFSLCLLASLVCAQSRPRLLDKETFLEMESVSSPTISPDGKQIVFTRTWVDKAKDMYRSNLWIIPDVEHTGGLKYNRDDYEDQVIEFFRNTLLAR